MTGISIETTLELWASSLRAIKARMAPLFTQERVAASAGLFLDGLLGGERRKTGFEVAQSSVAKYMVRRCRPPSQGWRTFLRNHAPDIAAMDLLVVPTIGFDLLYAFVIVRLDRRDLVWINVTANPTAEWIARQLTEAFPWNEAPRYLIRDRDRIYGAVVTRRLRAMGIRDKPTAPASPRQNGFAERLIGSIRRECVDHFIVLGEAHLRQIVRSYTRYYNDIRTHRSLDKDAPVSRPVQRTGSISSHAILGGLHHHYVRV
jgi:transposase InsO family protein